MKIEDYHFEIPEEPVDEKNFDIEKWRLENPVDYLKAVRLIDMFPDKNIAFDAIYKVMRYYLPDTLYKYYSLTDNISLNEQKFETLQQEKIFTCEAKFLNDPFDNKAYYYDNHKLKKFDVLKEHEGFLIDDFSSFSKVTALTSNKTNSMPMWAHYSNNHQGFCVSYDMKDERNIQLKSCTFPIQYSEERIDVTSLMIKQIETIFREGSIQVSQGKKEIELNDLSLVYMISLFTNIKHASWSYENEFRCTIGISEEISPYINAYPKEIYVGMKCNKTYKDKLISIGKELDIPVYQMTYDELSSDFNLTTSRL